MFAHAPCSLGSALIQSASHHLNLAPSFTLKPAARLHPVEIAVDVKLQKNRGWYAGRPVAAGSTPSKPRSVRSSPSTKQSTTRTELLSSTHSSSHSGNSVDCPRSAPSTKRFMNCSQQIAKRIIAERPFSRSQGQKLTFGGLLLLGRRRTFHNNGSAKRKRRPTKFHHLRSA